MRNADDMAQLAPLTPFDARDEPVSEPRESTRVLDALSTRAPRSAQELAKRSGLSEADVRAELGRMELAGTTREREGGWLRTKG